MVSIRMKSTQEGGGRGGRGDGGGRGGGGEGGEGFVRRGEEEGAGRKGALAKRWRARGGHVGRKSVETWRGGRGGGGENARRKGVFGLDFFELEWAQPLVLERRL